MVDPVLKPIIDWIIEFLIKQAIQHAPEVIKQARKQIRLPRRRQAFISRVGLVNRERELRAIRTALAEVPHLRILCLLGPGGVGKTRLLEETVHLARESATGHLLCWGGILDLYHIDLHSIFDFQTAILQGLDPERQHFQTYRKARDRFVRWQAEGLTGPALNAERRALDLLFIEDYKIFAQNRRPIIALDTVESLSYESDLIQTLCQLEDVSVVVQEWLLKWVDHLDNTVLLLAGRPQARLRRDLEQSYNNHKPGQLEIIELGGLSREDSHQLLKDILRKAPQPLKVLQVHSDRLWQLATGLPVQFTLIVELISQGEQLDLNAIQDITDHKAWGRHLISSFFSYDDPDRRILFFLALARKGVTANLLHHLEPDWSEAEWSDLLIKMRHLSMVKVRPGREETFLHDALYELFDAFAPPYSQLQYWYQRLSGYYRERQAKAGSDRIAWGEATVNLLYYELQLDPRQAFEAGYIRWDEIAIKGYEVGLDMQLRGELLRFFHSPLNQQRATAQGLSQVVIERDSAARWVKRLLTRTRYQQARTVAETILSLGPARYAALVSKLAIQPASLPEEQRKTAHSLFNLADPLFWGHLLTYYGEALTYTGASETQIHRVFNQAINLLSNVQLNRPDPLMWLQERVLGRAYNTLGYFLQNHGHFTDALKLYKSALKHFDAASITDEQAATLNNLAYLQAILGEASIAKDNMNQSLILRQRLGQQYPLALGYNTRGLIYSLQGDLNLGQRECQLALSIFEELSASRGIGLACNALGFILRQRGQRWKLGECSPEQATNSFQQSARFLNRARDIFSEVEEPIRLWEAYNERGCLSREWGYLFQQQGNNAMAQQQFNQAAQYLQQALEVAKKYRLHFQEADTYDDLAQICTNQGKMAEAQAYLKHCLALVPPKYTLKLDRGFRNAPKRGEAYWLILGKAFSQQATWGLRAIGEYTLAGNHRTEQVQACIEHFCMAVAFFQRYWSSPAAFNSRLHSIVHSLQEAGITPNEASICISQIEARYKVDLKVFLDIMGKNSSKTSG